MSQAIEPRRKKAILFMLLSAFSLSMMQIVVKLSASSIGTFEQVFFRNAVSLVISSVLLRRKNLPLVTRIASGKLMIRSLFGFLGVVFFFYATAHARQADVVILNRTSPVFVSLFSWLILREKIPKSQFLVITLCLAGCFFAMRPSFDSNIFPLVVAFLSAIVNGIAYVMIAACRGKVHPLQIVFHFSLFSAIASAVMALINFTVPTAKDLLFLLLIAVFGAGGQLGLTFAYQNAPASEVSIFNYASIPFSALLGALILNESYTIYTLFGALLIISGGLVGFFRSRGKSAS